MLEREVLADRVHKHPAPPVVINSALTVHREKWVRLWPGETMPEVLTATLQEITWSSFWPVSPDDTIEFSLSGGNRTHLRFRWLSSSPPDERGVGITRHRLNTRFGADIRGWLGSDEARTERAAALRPSPRHMRCPHCGEREATQPILFSPVPQALDLRPIYGTRSYWIGTGDPAKDPNRRCAACDWEWRAQPLPPDVGLT